MIIDHSIIISILTLILIVYGTFNANGVITKNDAMMKKAMKEALWILSVCCVCLSLVSLKLPSAMLQYAMNVLLIIMHVSARQFIYIANVTHPGQD